MAKAKKSSDNHEMKIRYGGGNSIELNTYVKSLSHFSNVVQEVNRELSKENKVTVNIKSTKPGSFIVDMDFIVQAASAGVVVKELFTKQNVAYAKQVIETVKEVYKVAKHLLGNKPKDVQNTTSNTVNIVNNNGVINVFDLKSANIYLKNATIKDAIAQEFETLENDPKVTSLELLDKSEKPMLKIDRKEFHILSTSGMAENLNDKERTIPVTTTLNISSLDLECKKKWDFYYQGNRISAKIQDALFGDRIDKGERFGKGDTFKVNMEIKQEFDDSVNAFVNKSYAITEIIEHIERPKQGKLNLPKD